MGTKQDHKRWRQEFNEGCLERDGHKCVFCDETKDLDVHHIVDRHELPNGGYAISNGITLCGEHHLLCEEYHKNGVCENIYHPLALFSKNNTTFVEVYLDCKSLR